MRRFREEVRELTITSAITRGCLIGFKSSARVRVINNTKQIWMMSRGKAKLMGLSPCQTPSDVAFIGEGHFGRVALEAIAARVEYSISIPNILTPKFTPLNLSHAIPHQQISPKDPRFSALHCLFGTFSRPENVSKDRTVNLKGWWKQNVSVPWRITTSRVPPCVLHSLLGATAFVTEDHECRPLSGQVRMPRPR